MTRLLCEKTLFLRFLWLTVMAAEENRALYGFEASLHPLQH